MEDFQLVLSILGAIAIIAVLVHGFWSIRKQQPKTLKDNPMTGFYKGQAEQRDSQGFDADGIGEVRRVKADEVSVEPVMRQSKVSPHLKPNVSSSQLDSAELEITAAGSKKGIGLQNQSAVNVQAPSYHPGRKDPVMTTAAKEPEHIPTQQALFGEEFNDDSNEPFIDDPIEKASVTKAESNVSSASVHSPEHQTLAQEPLTPVVETAPKAEPVEEPLGEPQDVLVLHVVARDGEQLQGAELLPCLLSLNFKFGDMDIFHRHQDNAGNGKVLFSMANMLKPGVFDPDNMEQFATQGVVLFMTLPCHGDALRNFSIMLNSAQQLADDLGAEVLDDKRNAWTDTNKQAYLSRIRAVS
ncbi:MULTISPECIES: cell division protein ZipA [unclassified Shewanella]|uniref:cell division protein ZipA n=1 Tax=unclassified Shewanella TaxID=196818 RepID=UPI000C8658AC|nr:MULTISPECIES: cell division protein ZipA [unclassified Shewanella]MDO6678202.1 cell division protein ZipA [Shewanella sp. 4_MG-2023]PMH84684.1 cell division protein ZipA [Shewanella sp. 10N.286.48.B5]PMI02404.1 cell division protein ZipA [Shewanella sp. 10N.286.48.A6]